MEVKDQEMEEEKDKEELREKELVHERVENEETAKEIKMWKKIIWGLIIGSLPVILLWTIVSALRPTDPYGYGMAILPLIFISIVLFIIGFAGGCFLMRKIQNKKYIKK